jgi:hypothetical protein
MQMSEAPLTSLEILSALSHALSHQIRTPLSVISNDLFYLQSLVPEGECARALKRCQEISAVLQSVALQEELFESPAAISAREAFGLFSSEEQRGADKILVQASPAILELLGKSLKELLALLGTEAARFSLRSADSWAVLTFSQAVSADFAEGAFASFTRYFSGHAALDAVQPMLLDAMTGHLKGTVKVCCHSGLLEGEICLPGRVG